MTNELFYFEFNFECDEKIEPVLGPWSQRWLKKQTEFHSFFVKNKVEVIGICLSLFHKHKYPIPDLRNTGHCLISCISDFETKQKLEDDIEFEDYKEIEIKIPLSKELKDKCETKKLERLTPNQQKAIIDNISLMVNTMSKEIDKNNKKEISDSIHDNKVKVNDLRYCHDPRILDCGSATFGRDQIEYQQNANLFIQNSEMYFKIQNLEKQIQDIQKNRIQDNEEITKRISDIENLLKTSHLL